MKTKNLLMACSLLAGLLMAATATAKNSYLNSVNSTCSTDYSCDLCHVDPSGGGPRTADGEAFIASGYDPTYFCAGTTCTDFDADGFATEGGTCGLVDCDDNNPAINPGAAEVCDDGIDNDCDAAIDCADGECALALVCGGTPLEPEICSDGIDNDGDNKVDCADKKDCGKDLFCVIDGGGGPTPSPEICDDGIDNDLDGKTDCSDKKDCGKDPAC